MTMIWISFVFSYTHFAANRLNILIKYSNLEEGILSVCYSNDILVIGCNRQFVYGRYSHNDDMEYSTDSFYILEAIYKLNS